MSEAHVGRLLLLLLLLLFDMDLCPGNCVRLLVTIMNDPCG